ncbi:MAG: hypothetical protein HY040_02560 [Planctomycetes bacterium]|nr:hypothetical protein [Planctomycetota bacterium]
MGVKSRSKKNHPGWNASRGVETGANLKRRIILILALLLAGGGTWAFFEFVLWNKIPSDLVGKWEVVDGPREYAGATLEFFRQGKLVVRVNRGGDLGIIDATIRVAGKKIFSTTQRPTTGETSTSAFVILTLTDRELIVEDEQGNPMKMRRAQ